MAVSIIGIGTVRSAHTSLHCSKPTGDFAMLNRFNTLLDRTALTVFLVVAAVPVFCFPLLAVSGIH